MSKEEISLVQLRAENDEKLLSRISSIEEGEAVDVLEAFAKAYLGLYLDIDNSLSADERVAQLANPQLCAAILSGFEAYLQKNRLPLAHDIGVAMGTEQLPIEIFVAIAAIERRVEQHTAWREGLSEATLQSLLCSFYALNRHEGNWHEELLAEPALASTAMHQFWMGVLSQRQNYLPALSRFLAQPEHPHVLRYSVIDLLQQWPKCNKKMLRRLLETAFREANLDALLDLARQRIEVQTSVAKKTLWLATAYLLAPHDYAEILQTYLGRSKEKLLPLFDFSVAILRSPASSRLNVSAYLLQNLIRPIAPRFPPRQNDFGQLEEKTKNVLWLLQRLGEINDSSAYEAVLSLRKVRVMRVYAEVLDTMAESLTVVHQA